MSVIAKISCCLECSVITLKLCREYLNTVTLITPVLLWIKNWTVWCIACYSMSTYTGAYNYYIITNCQKSLFFSAHPVYEASRYNHGLVVQCIVTALIAMCSLNLLLRWHARVVLMLYTTHWLLLLVSAGACAMYIGGKRNCWLYCCCYKVIEILPFPVLKQFTWQLISVLIISVQYCYWYCAFSVDNAPIFMHVCFCWHSGSKA